MVAERELRNSAIEAACPAIVEFLSMDVWDDGKRREPGTVMVMFEEGRWKAWVNDKEGKRSAWVSGATLEALWSAVEGGLVEDSLDWRRARPQRGRGA